VVKPDDRFSALPEQKRVASRVESDLGWDRYVETYSDTIDRFFDDPVRLSSELKKLKRVESRMKEAQRLGQEVDMDAMLSGDEGTMDAVARAAKNVGKAGLKGAGKAIDAIQYPVRKVRGAISGEESEEGFNKYLKEKHPEIWKVGQVVGSAVGLSGAVPGAGLAAAADVLSGNRSVSEAAGHFKDVLIEDAPDMGASFALNTLADPLTYITFGGGRSLTAASKQLQKAAKLSGVSGKGFAQAAEKVLLESAGKPGLQGKLGAVAKEYGVSESSLAKVLGDDYRLLGTEGLKVAGVELPGNKAIRDAATAVSTPFRKRFGAIKGVVDPEAQMGLSQLDAEAVKQRIGQMRHSVEDQYKRELMGLNEELAPIAKRIPVSRQREILKNHIDPDFDLIPTNNMLSEPGVYIRMDEKSLGLVGDNPRIMLRPGQVMDEVLPPGQMWMHVKPKNPALNLSSDEKAYVSSVEGFFLRQKDRMKEVGALDESDAAFNWLSGQYVPRRFHEGSRSLVKREFRLNPKWFDRGPKGGVALGSKVSGPKAQLDMDKIIVNYQRRAERAVQGKYLDRWVADHFQSIGGSGTIELVNSSGNKVHVPQSIYNGIKGYADNAFKHFNDNIFDTFMGMFKQSALLGVPRYHLVNITGDSMLMFANGMSNPGMLKKARDLFSGKLGGITQVSPSGARKTYSSEQLTSFLRANGVGEGLGRFDIRRTADMTGSDFRRKVKEGLLDIGSGGIPGLSMRRLGIRTAAYWDETAKTAFFLDRIKKGDTPEQAIARTHEVLFDYVDQDKLLQGLKKVMPFATWNYKALKAIPRTIIRSPGRAAMPIHYAEMLEHDEAMNEEPGFMKERANTLQLSGEQVRAVKEWAKLIKKHTGVGGEISSGAGIAMNIRDPISEMSGTVLTPLTSTVNQLSPVIKMLAEAVFEKDAFTKKELKSPQALKMFRHGDPLAVALEKRLSKLTGEEWGGRLQAHGKQNAWFARSIPQHLASPLSLLILNELTGSKMGNWRPYSEASGERNALQFINSLTGTPLSATSPAFCLTHSIASSRS